MDPRTHAHASVKHLQQVELFRDLPEDELLRIAGRLSYRSAPRGTVIFQEGDPSQGLYIIETGQVRMVRSAGAAPLPGETLGPGMPFGDMSLLTGEPLTATATVTIDVELWFLAKADFDQLLHTYPSIAINLSRLLARRLQLVDRERTYGAPPDIKRLIGLVGDPQAALQLARRVVKWGGCRLLLLETIDTGDENSTLDPGDPFADVAVVDEGVDRLEVAVELSSGDFSEVVSHLLRKYDQLLIRLPDQESKYGRDALELCEALIVCGHRPGHWALQAATPAQPVWRLGDAGEGLARGPAGAGRLDRDRDRLARRLVGKRVGVALSSGGAHGLAHIGLLLVLDQEGIPVDLVAGTSMGSVIGGAYAAGRRGDELIQVGREVGAIVSPRTVWRYVDPWPSRSGLVGTDRIEQLIKRWVMHKRFEDLEIPFFAVATEVISGRAVVFTSGPLSRAIRASSSVPGFARPVPDGDDFLMDGAAADPVPCAPLAAAGAEVIIACNVIPQIPDRLYRRMNQRRANGVPRPPSLLEIAHSEAEIMAAQIALLKARPYDVLIQPKVGRYSWTDGHRVTEFVRLGEAAARAALPQIRELLKPGAKRVRRGG